MKFFDTHAHLTSERFDEDRDSLILSLPQKGIARVIDVACDVREADKTIELIEKYDFIYATVGMHPHEAAETEMHHIDEIQKYLRHEKMLALGEIGLDYYYDFAPREVQKKWFVMQLELAQELNVPVIFHVRDAFGDFMDILRAHKKGLKGIMHCYSGSVESAYECMDMGLYISFAGAVTFSNASKLAAVAKNIPDENLLIETDCPYLTPTPHRGKRNDPSLVRHTAQKLAELRNVSVEHIANITYENAIKVFEIEK